MRRLQANLAYLASLADRKGTLPVARGPQLLNSPPLNLKIRMRGHSPVPASEASETKPDLQADREDRDRYLKELYRKLQAQYPGVDPRKEPAFPLTNGSHGAHGAHGQNAGQKPGSAQGSNQASPAPQKTPQMATVPAPSQSQAVAT